MGRLSRDPQHYPNVFRVLEIGDQRGLSRLVFEIPTQVCTAKPAAQFSFFSTKEVLRNIICTLDYRQNPTVLIATCGVAEEMLPIAFKILQDDTSR